MTFVVVPPSRRTLWRTSSRCRLATEADGPCLGLHKFKVRGSSAFAKASTFARGYDGQVGGQEVQSSRRRASWVCEGMFDAGARRTARGGACAPRIRWDASKKIQHIRIASIGSVFGCNYSDLNGLRQISIYKLWASIHRLWGLSSTAIGSPAGFMSSRFVVQPRRTRRGFKVREGGRRGFAKGCSTRGRVELHAGAT